MRIVLNALQAGNRSGTGRYTVELAKRLPALAEDCETLLIWPKHMPVPEQCRTKNCSHHLVSTESPFARFWWDQVRVRAKAEHFRADVVHFPASIGSLARSPNVVLTVHDVGFLRDPDWFRWDRAAYYRFAIGRSIRLAAHVLADSEATAADLVEFFGIPHSKMTVVPLGVGEEFRPASEEQKIAARERHALPERFFLYVGTLEPRKNLVRVIQAWSQVAERDDSVPDLVIAGRDGWKHVPIREAAQKSPCTRRIHFPGFIANEDLPAVLSAAQVFVWPSLWEGFGLPPLEAMACGIPVITSNVSSIPEAVGDAALGVDPYDVDAIADAMRMLAENEALRAAFSTKGLARAAAFTWDNTARRTYDVYRNTAGKQPPEPAHRRR